MSFKIKVLAVFVISLLGLGATLYFVSDSQAEKLEFWITVDEKELTYVKKSLTQQAQFDLEDSEIHLVENGIALLRLNEPQMELLSRGMHESFHKCSGYIAHSGRDEAINSIRSLRDVSVTTQFVEYTINNQATVNALLSEAKELDNRQVILDLSAFPNRRYNQQSGMDSANWIKNKWTALATGRSDVTVDFFAHPAGTSPQPSIIMTIQGTTLPDEIVVLGAHQDSINTGGATLLAPGADDDASGIASLTETIRVLMAKGFRPNRTLKFMAYAAEEVGLRGSNAIATDFRNQNKNVVGVLQLDMTNYKGSPAFDIVLIQDFTNAAQNQFVQNLVTTYQPALILGTTSCGYACSDHASWHNKSYPASMPAEATFADTNSALHTVNDTISRSNGNANHALKFSKLAISYVGELAKGAIASQRKPYVDFDGDGKTDISIFRPSVGEWYYQRSSNSAVNGAQFGSSTDKPSPADYTGDGKTDIAFFRPASGEWFILRSEDSSYYAFPFGASTDIPTPGDFDGDSKADVAVFRPSNGVWYISRSTGGVTSTSFGTNGDRTVVADYDGDGKSDIAIFRPSVGEWYYIRSIDSQVRGAQFGSATDKPVHGDYTGDGKADFAFFRPSNGFWYVLRSEDFSFFASPFGALTDTPTPGDYDGDGKFDQAVFRPSNGVWYINKSNGSGVIIQQFGVGTDLPVPSYYLP